MKLAESSFGFVPLNFSVQIQIEKDSPGTALREFFAFRGRFIYKPGPYARA